MSTMLYELHGRPPEPGSLLESVFVMIAKRRQESEYYKTKAIVTAMVADKMEGGGQRLIDALDTYRDSLFPYLASEAKKKDRLTKKALKQWTSKILKIRPVWRVKDHKAVVSSLRRGAEKVRESEKLRRRRRHLRLV